MCGAMPIMARGTASGKSSNGLIGRWSKGKCGGVMREQVWGHVNDGA
jgi:hypothetical protein